MGASGRRKDEMQIMKACNFQKVTVFLFVCKEYSLAQSYYK